MTQDELKAYLLLSGFENKDNVFRSRKYKLLWAEIVFNIYGVTVRKYGIHADHKWSTFRASPQTALDFIKEQLT